METHRLIGAWRMRRDAEAAGIPVEVFAVVLRQARDDHFVDADGMVEERQAEEAEGTDPLR